MAWKTVSYVCREASGMAIFISKPSLIVTTSDRISSIGMTSESRSRAWLCILETSSRILINESRGTSDIGRNLFSKDGIELSMLMR